jgi:hypothetical protein
MKSQNLTDPLEIKHALERKLGYGAIKQIASCCGVTSSAVSKIIRHRGSKKVLKCVATTIGQPVHGIMPDKDISMKY